MARGGHGRGQSRINAGVWIAGSELGAGFDGLDLWFMGLSDGLGFGTRILYRKLFILHMLD